MNRKNFLRLGGSAFLILASGEIISARDLLHLNPDDRKKVKLRFAVASDGHYGEKNTAYEKYFADLVSNVNIQNTKAPFAFCMINGDIVHDDKTLYPAAKKALDELQPKYYVSQGNHDHVSPSEWESIWNMPLNHDFAIDSNSFLIATTSNEKGDYLCPNLKWFESTLLKHKDQENIFIFIHINPGRSTKHGVDCPELFEILTNYKNIRGVFNGHDHDEEGIKMKNEIPFLFDAHFGGSWGTDYHGFRIVEVLKDNSILTYIMNPEKKINQDRLAAIKSM